MKEKIVFIINPIAGRGKANSIIDSIPKLLDKDKYDFEIVISKKKDDVSKITLEQKNKGANIIVAVGGDGTVNEVAKNIAFSDVKLGIIPFGSGNGLANHLGISKDLIKAIDTINKGKYRKIDTAHINGYFFISLAGVGFDATVARRYAKSGKRGFKTYLKYSLLSYFSYKPAKYKIRINNEIISRKALFISFANSDQFGYNTSIAPEAVIDDGYIDMCIVYKVPLIYSPFVLSKLFTRKIHKSKFYESYKIEEVFIYRKRKSVIQVDGESVKMKSSVVHVKCNPLSISVIS